MQDSAAPAAVAGRRGAAAGRPGARGDDPDRRPLRRPASPVSRMVSAGLVLLAASFFLMLGVGTGDLARADRAVGGDRPARPGHRSCRRSTSARCRACRTTLIAHGSSTINFMRQLGGAVGISLVGNVLEWRLQARRRRADRRLPRNLRAGRRDHRAARCRAALARWRRAAGAPADDADHRSAGRCHESRLDLLPERCDVIVVGAGPAGSAAALTLARAGLDVVLVDAQAFPRDKVCGDGLIPDAHHALRQLGVLDAVMARGAAGERRRLHRRRAAAASTCRARSPCCRASGSTRSSAAPRSRPARACSRRCASSRRSRRAAASSARACSTARRVREVRAPWLVLASGAVPQATARRGHVASRRTPSGIALRGYVEERGDGRRASPASRSSGTARSRPATAGSSRAAAASSTSASASPRATREARTASTTKQEVNLREVFDAFTALYAPARELDGGGGALLGPSEGRAAALHARGRALLEARACSSPARRPAAPTPSPARASARRWRPAACRRGDPRPAGRATRATPPMPRSAPTTRRASSR